MMRKDVKVGLASGAVLLAVGIVYVSSINKPPTARQVSALEPSSPARERATPTPNNPPTGGGRIVIGESTNRETVADRTPMTETVVNVPTEQDWGKLLGTGAPPALMSHTPTATPPTGGATAAAAPTANPNGEPVDMFAESTPIGPVATAGASQQDAARLNATTAIPSAPVVPTLSATMTTPAAAVTPAMQTETVVRTQPGSTGTSGAGQANGAGAVQTYTVKEGESFYTIARQVYGNSHFFPHIQRANPDIVPNRIRAGMKINLPSPDSVKPSAAAKAAANERAADADDAAVKPIKTQKLAGAGEYRVGENENLYRIAMKLYGSPKKVDEIYELNKATIGSDPAKLKVGTMLKLPAGAKVAQ